MRELVEEVFQEVAQMVSDGVPGNLLARRWLGDRCASKTIATATKPAATTTTTTRRMAAAGAAGNFSNKFI